jgi:hypothetical protein
MKLCLEYERPSHINFPEMALFVTATRILYEAKVTRVSHNHAFLDLLHYFN